MKTFTTLLFLAQALSWQTFSCPILNSSNQIVTGLGDPLFEILNSTKECPQNVIEFRTLLEQEGAKFTTTMVANRGFHNPKLGSFSFFEMTEIAKPRTLSKAVKKEELFFGHFTGIGPNGSLTLEQTPDQNSLMIELIAWDRETKLYNFYELIGGAKGPNWFYRGNSADIWSDVSKLHLNPGQAKPSFGSKLRCSGCHVSGGPIQKEFSMPHDSWWFEERPLPFGNLKPDAKVKKLMESLQDPMELANSVALGISKVTDSKIKKQTNLRIALRPLFCAEELQLQSSPYPLSGPEKEVTVPLGFFLDERLGASEVTRTSKADYLKALKELGSRFPETAEVDADHAWLTPVKAVSDSTAIDRLVGGAIDKEFVADVLAVDMTRPLFSQKRCELLRLVPEKGNDWKTVFEANLKQSPLPHAKVLFENLTDQTKNARYHQTQAQKYIEKCKSKLQTAEGVLELVKYLGQIRAEAFASEISQNPKGQILEPGFRVIFPDFKSFTAKPWSKALNEECEPVP